MVVGSYFSNTPPNESLSSPVSSSADLLYKELWHACAGPLVTMPQEGERVYYFPQGHMEQVFCKLYMFIF